MNRNSKRKPYKIIEVKKLPRLIDKFSYICPDFLQNQDSK